MKNIWSKSKYWKRNENFDEKHLFKIRILVINKKLVKINFGQQSKSKIWSKIKNLVKNQKFGQKSTFWSKIKIVFQNRGKIHEIDPVTLLVI